MVIWPILPIGFKNFARSLFRHKTITCFPARASRSTNALPTNPDPPITVTLLIMIFLCLTLAQAVHVYGGCGAISAVSHWTD